MVYVVVLVYALFRWGSGREVAIGSGVILTAFVVGMVEDFTTLAELVAAFIFLWFPAVLGASVRFWRTSRNRELDQVRLREREQLARELHDTVAHHVSAMVVRAQAGRIVAATRPAAASEALEVIEAEGSRTLAEMRVMVGALRDGDDADLAPQRGVADIQGLARTLGDQPRVEVQVSGDVDDLGPAVGAAVYRIAQESLTNAMRHARHAARVVVRIAGDEHSVRITVDDDGDAVSAAWVQAGYGIVGMTERATLLGGTITIGPGPERGWVVDAVFPRVGSVR
jgi:signal transduction histidine kinase